MAAKEGIAYILMNEAMPGFVKIEFTQKEDLADEVRRLNRSSIPMPYYVYYAAKVPDCNRLKKTIIFLFGDKRTGRNRDFFEIGPDTLKATIELVASTIVELNDTDQGIEPGERKEIDRSQTRREVQNVKALDMLRGSTLKFINDDSISCTFVGEGRVKFDGAVVGLSEAALKAVQKIGYDWNTINGFDFWSYRGTRLSDFEEFAATCLVDDAESPEPVFVPSRSAKSNAVEPPFIVLK